MAVSPFLVLTILVQAAGQAASGLNAGQSGATGSVIWKALDRVIPIESLAGYNLEGPYPQYVFDLALDPSGTLHIIGATGPHRARQKEDMVIEHFLLIDGEVKRLPDIKVEHARVTAIRAQFHPSGTLYLLWAEDQYFDPTYHREELYLKVRSGDTWGETQPVLDRRAKPLVFATHGATLLVHRAGVVDVLWEDWREWHLLPALLSMGHAGNFPKTFHRRLDSTGWQPVRRVQRRGTFDVNEFEALTADTGAVALFWTKDHLSTARILRSNYERGKWKTDGLVATCSSDVGEGDIHEFSAREVVTNFMKIAWICSWFERQGNTVRNDPRNDLWVSTFAGGVWKTGPRLSRRARSVRWVWSDHRTDGLIVQEDPPGIFPWADGPCALSLVELREDSGPGIELLSARSVADFFEVEGGHNGEFHLVYLERLSESKAQMKYRRGMRSN